MTVVAVGAGYLVGSFVGIVLAALVLNSMDRAALLAWLIDVPLSDFYQNITKR